MIYDVIFNPFWKNVLDGLKLLWKKGDFICDETVLFTPQWYNLSSTLEVGWKKVIYTIRDALDLTRLSLGLHTFEEKYNSKTMRCHYANSFLSYNAALSITWSLDKMCF